MSSRSSIAIFDIGKTNKKLLVFDEDYQVIWERSTTLPPSEDDDGDPCEDLAALEVWMQESLHEARSSSPLEIRCINFAAYGASFVHVDQSGSPVAPLYDYLKPFPEDIAAAFYSKYGSKESMALETASPTLGNLNSGMQLYLIRHSKPEMYRRISTSLHLPQYLSFRFSHQPYSDLTSIGCHTQLWNFGRQGYHDWVLAEGLDKKLAPIAPANKVIQLANEKTSIGIGIHDSSAALVPYLVSFRSPFTLLSTGTWSISLNPFNSTPLTLEELRQDCLCYLSYEGNPVKASRFFAGHEHELFVKSLSSHFHTQEDFFSTLVADPSMIKSNLGTGRPNDLRVFHSYEEAYLSFMQWLVEQQVRSTRLVLGPNKNSNIYVDGGFSKNTIFMQLLAKSFPTHKVYAAFFPQATALGAAMILHAIWNSKSFPPDIIKLVPFSGE